MIRILPLILTVGGMTALILGILGAFENNFVTLSPWVLTTLGSVFLSLGYPMLKYRKDEPSKPIE